MHSGRNFPYSAQVVLVLFVLSHSITPRHQYQGYHTEKRKKRKNDNKHRDGLHSLYLQIMQSKQSTEEYWLNIKNQTLWMCVGEIALKIKECFSPRLRQSWMKDVRFKSWLNVWKVIKTTPFFIEKKSHFCSLVIKKIKNQLNKALKEKIRGRQIRLKWYGTLADSWF